MEPIAIALVVSVLFNLYCFKEIKALNYELNHVKEQNRIYTINEDINRLFKQAKPKSLGFVYAYEYPNQKYMVSNFPQTKKVINKHKSTFGNDGFIGIAEVILVKPEK